MAKTPTAPASVSAPTPPTPAAVKPKRAARRINVNAAAERAVQRATTGTLKRGEALGFDGEIVSRSRSTGFKNEFEVPAHLIPQGFVAQWVRNSCHGKPDPANVGDHMANGWRSNVPKSVLDHFRVPAGQDHVERDGLTLMMRPQQLNDEALADERRAAVELKQAQAEQFGARKLPSGFDDGAVSGDGRFDARRKIRRSVEGAPASLLPDRPLAVGDDD